MISVKEARKLSKEYVPQVDTEELDAVYDLIRKAAMEGMLTMRANIKHKSTMEYLSKAGYGVTIFAELDNDEKQIKVSWAPFKAFK